MYKIHCQLVYDERYMKTKVKAFNGIVNTVFSDDKIPEESIHYIFIAATNIDSVMKIDKKLSSSLYRRIQIQDEEEKNGQLY